MTKKFGDKYFTITNESILLNHNSLFNNNMSDA